MGSLFQILGADGQKRESQSLPGSGGWPAELLNDVYDLFDVPFVTWRVSGWLNKIHDSIYELHVQY